MEAGRSVGVWARGGGGSPYSGSPSWANGRRVGSPLSSRNSWNTTSSVGSSPLWAPFAGPSTFSCVPVVPGGVDRMSDDISLIGDKRAGFREELLLRLLEGR